MYFLVSMPITHGVRFLALAGGVSTFLAFAGFLVAVEPPGLVTMVAVGDIMLSRNVAAKMRAAGDPLLPFRNVSALLSASDFNFGNLESPFSPPEDAGADALWDGIIGGTSLVFAAPHQSVQALSRYNFRVLALANNHAMDQGKAGLAHTIEHLHVNGIEPVGAGSNLEEAWRAGIVHVKNRRIGFLAASYASLNYGTDERNDYVARIQDRDRLAARIHALASQADFIVVCMHAGDEYAGKPSPAQVEFAHAAIDAGAAVVIGSHPHWIQPLEWYKGGLILYSLGNFVFDLDSTPATREGLAVKLRIGPNGLAGAELYPVEIENSCCPRPATPAEIPGALRRLGIVQPARRELLLEAPPAGVGAATATAPSAALPSASR